MGKLSVTDIQKMVYIEYVKNGYLEKWQGAQDILPEEDKGIVDIAELGLIDTETGEAKEAVRNGDLDNLGEECVDVIIRTLNFMSRKGINAESLLLMKHSKNMKREKLHGRRV